MTVPLAGDWTTGAIRAITRRSSAIDGFPHSSHSGTPAFDNSIVDGEFLASLDVSCREIDAVEFFPWINSDVGRVAVIYEAIIIAAKNKSVTPGIDVSVVQHGFTEVSWLLFECTRIEV
jgi:hypothetical protein